MAIGTDRMCKADTLIYTVAARLPLDEIAAAHEAMESGGVMGNVVLDIADLDSAYCARRAGEPLPFFRHTVRCTNGRLQRRGAMIAVSQNKTGD